VSSISRFAEADNVRGIFSCLGDILHLEFRQKYARPSWPVVLIWCETSLAKKDGTFEANLVFTNLSEASLALKLDRTELGDRSFTVEPIMNRFRFGVSPGAPKTRLSKDSPFGGPEAVRTLLVRGLASGIGRPGVEAFVSRLVGEAPSRVALYGHNILRLPGQAVGDFDSAMAAIEFSTRDLMLRAILLLRDTKPEGVVAPGRALLYAVGVRRAADGAVGRTRRGSWWTRTCRCPQRPRTTPSSTASRSPS
jgi:hypothetical protein